MSGHTPGPWAIVNREIRGPDGSGVIVARIPEWGVAADAPDPFAANARLIAAAPDLLEVAKSAARLLWEIASEVDDGVRTLNEDSAEGKLWTALTDAIDKAEGTS